MKYGLSEAQLREIINFIAQYPEVETAVLFGSRALGTYKEASDVDIALQGEKVNFSLAAKMKFNIEEDTYLPFFFDFIAYPGITNDELKKHIDDKGIVIFRRGAGGGEWQEMTLEAVAHINPTESLSKGAMAKKVAMTDIQSFTKKVATYSVEPYNGGMKFRNGDTLVARITPCLENGKTAYVDILDDDEIGFGSTEYIVIREKLGVSDKQFLYYFSISSEFRDIAILSMTGSSGRQRVQTEVVTNHRFLLPSLSEQKAIASVLSSLDDKIDLLHRQNKTLEAMAETLFRQWFVEEAQEDWETVKVGDFVKTNVSSVTQDSMLKSIRYLDTGSLNEGRIEGFQVLDIKDAPSRARRIVKHNDVLISTVRPDQKHYGIIKNPDEDIIVSTGFCVISCEKINPHFIYIFLTTRDMTEYLHSIAEASTSTYPSLKPSDIESLEFKRPPEDKLREFSAYADNAWSKIEYNHIQIRTLEKLRDTLLPKLMSGEVRVDYEH